MNDTTTSKPAFYTVAAASMAICLTITPQQAAAQRLVMNNQPVGTSPLSETLLRGSGQLEVMLVKKSLAFRVAVTVERLSHVSCHYKLYDDQPNIISDITDAITSGMRSTNVKSAPILEDIRIGIMFLHIDGKRDSFYMQDYGDLHAALGEINGVQVELLPGVSTRIRSIIANSKVRGEAADPSYC